MDPQDNVSNIYSLEAPLRDSETFQRQSLVDNLQFIWGCTLKRHYGNPVSSSAVSPRSGLIIAVLNQSRCDQHPETLRRPGLLTFPHRGRGSSSSPSPPRLCEWVKLLEEEETQRSSCWQWLMLLQIMPINVLLLQDGFGQNHSFLWMLNSTWGEQKKTPQKIRCTSLILPNCEIGSGVI